MRHGKIFKMEDLRRRGNAILNLTFENNSAILLIVSAEFTESVLDILPYPASTIRHTTVGPAKNFLMEVLIWLENAMLRLVFCKYSIS